MVCSPHASLSFTLTFRARATPNDEIQAGFRPKPAKLPDCQKSRRTVRRLFFVRDVQGLGPLRLLMSWMVPSPTRCVHGVEDSMPSE